MKARIAAALASTMFCLGSGAADAADHAAQERSPQAGARTYAQNFKDMVLAQCVSTAYKAHDDVVKDAGSSVSALQEWTFYDIDKYGFDLVTGLVDKYLARDYTNPLVESEMKGVRFDMLKCLDLYHGKELDDLVKRVVMKPGRSYRLDHPPTAH